MDQHMIEGLLGQYGWMAVVAFVLLIGRSTIESAIEAIKVAWNLSKKEQKDQ